MKGNSPKSNHGTLRNTAMGTLRKGGTLMPQTGYNPGAMATTIAAPKGIGSKALSKIANKAVASNLRKSREANQGITINVPSYGGTLGMQGGYAAGGTLLAPSGGSTSRNSIGRNSMGRDNNKGQTFAYHGTVQGTIAENEIRPTKEESHIIGLVNNKDLGKLICAIIDYKKNARYSFWHKFQVNGILALHNVSRHLDPPYRSMIIGILCGGEYYDADLIRVTIGRNDYKTALIVTFVYKYIKKRMPNSAFRNLHNGSMSEFIKSWKHECSLLVQAINNIKRPHKETLSEGDLKDDVIHVFKCIDTQRPEELMDYMLFASKGKLKKVSIRFYESFGMTIPDFARNHNLKPHYLFIIQILIPTSVNLLYALVNLMHESTMMDEIEILFPYILSTAVKIDCKNIKRIYSELTSEALTDLVSNRFRPPISTYFLSML